LYKSPIGKNMWTSIGILTPNVITVIANNPMTPEAEPTPEMPEHTLNFFVQGGFQEGAYDLKVEVHLGSSPLVVAEKVTSATFQERQTIRILYTLVNYNGDLPSGDFADAYLLLKGAYPMQFDPENQWIADPSVARYLSPLSTVGCGGGGFTLLTRLALRRIAYNASQPPETRADYIVGFVADSRLEVDGCSRKSLRAAFVTDKSGGTNTTLAHEIGHLLDLPIPSRRVRDIIPPDTCLPSSNLGCEEYSGTSDPGYLIDEGFDNPIPDRKHFFDFSTNFAKFGVTISHSVFYNFMGTVPQSWVDEKTYIFLYDQLQP
jgi:hypothetical protein